jgi:hypothetical protein
MLASLIEGRTLENRHVALEAHLVTRGTSREPANGKVAA